MFDPPGVQMLKERLKLIEKKEAEMAKLRLESAGIEVFLSGENARIMEPGLGPLELQVSSDDEADARAILADPGEPAADNASAQ